MDDFEAFIYNLTSENPSQNVASIKNAVISRLEASDSDVTVESTDYFNHTYAPDLVLRWHGDHSIRPVFLRTSDNPEYIREDVSVIANQRPIIMPLTVLRDSQNAEALKVESAQASTLVATPSTISTFADTQGDKPVLGLLSKAVLQGGRGFVDQDRARSATATVDAGFTAAQHAEVKSTRDALTTAEDLLDATRAGILTRLLHAVWLGSGAPASTFPGAGGIATSLDAAGLKLLLDVVTSSDAEFWRRIGAGLTLERLCEIDASQESENLQHLVNSNLDRFRAKSLQLSDVTTSPVAAPEALRWFLHSGMLGLKDESFVSHFSPGPVSSLGSSTGSPSRQVRLRELVDRAALARVTIDELVIEAENGRRLEYRLPANTYIWDDPVLEEFSLALGKGSFVTSATVPLEGRTRHLKCDLQKHSAAGRTAAKFTLRELLNYALPVLGDLSPATNRKLAELTTQHDG
nr:hypothetical protein KitaXyl93_34630 [Kitasatospora sp. Xyl93]